ncbi:type I toxin-antitoxin system SymE family toxin, partial [Bacteroidales bacterium OttesenSCG-928-B11]|nr:type I toxin-antitoxin system SymE family toxin [Bacteroidales bacterium OttesenSCG-928-B11]
KQKGTTFKKVIRPKQDEISIQFKVEEPRVRYLKLQPFCRWSKSNLLYKPKGKIVPELRLCGNWLEAAGFSPNEYVSVTVMDGLLIIRQAKEEGE